MGSAAPLVNHLLTPMLFPPFQSPLFGMTGVMAPQGDRGCMLMKGGSDGICDVREPFPFFILRWTMETLSSHVFFFFVELICRDICL